MSEQTLDLVETLWGTLYDGQTLVPTLLRSHRGNIDYRAPSGAPPAGFRGPTMLLRTEEVAPNGQGGECIFTALHLALRWTAPMQVDVYPMVDGLFGVPYDPERGTNNFSVPYVYWPSQLATLGLGRPLISLVLGQQPALNGAVLIGQARARAQEFQVPLYTSVITGSPNVSATTQELSRNYLRGTRISTVLVIAPYGHGEISVDGCEVEYETLVGTTRFPSASQRPPRAASVLGVSATNPTPPRDAD